MDKWEDLDEEDLYPLRKAPCFQSSEGNFLLRAIEQADIKYREHDSLKESCANEWVHEEAAIADAVAARNEVRNYAEYNDEKPWEDFQVKDAIVKLTKEYVAD